MQQGLLEEWLGIQHGHLQRHKHWLMLERVVSKAGELHHGFFFTLVIKHDMYCLVENLDFERLLNT